MGTKVVSIERPAGRGRQPADVEACREAELELLARRAEAIALVNGLQPLLSSLIPGCRELGPRHYQTALAMQDRLNRFRRQQDEPEPRRAA